MNTDVPPFVPPSELPEFIFSWIDYTVFAVLLSLSVSIGIYFGFFTKQNSTEEYLLGGKNMNSIAVAISLVASFISGITLLGLPADVYKFGSNYIWGCLSVSVACLLTGYVYLPVFFKLQFTTLYEYLDVRFDRKCRTLASFLFTLNMLIYNPIVIYVPALALSQATGLNIHYITPAISIICIFYTAIGGLRAVVWTDTLQFFGIIGSCLAIIILGLKETGGFAAIWNINKEGRRLDLLNFEFDPTIRDGPWALLIGGTFYWCSTIVTNQGTLQKFLAVPSLTTAKRVLAMYCFGVVILIGVNVLTGNILYAKYFNCDPFLSNRIQRHDQVLPFFLMDIGGRIIGFPGIFFAGIFSATLSSLSAGLNAVSGTLYQDFILPFMPLNTTQKTASKILKLLVVIVGTVCILLVFVIEQMGGIIALITTVLLFEFDPTIRDGAWALLIGGTFDWSCAIVTNQGIIQKFLAVPSLTIARKVLAMYCFGVVMLIGVSVLTGNILYSKYFNCDPFLSNRIQRDDQILPFFLMEIGGSIPGFPGIFFAGIFSAALSSFSASLNAVSGTLYQDFILPFMPLNTTQKTASNILKVLVVIVGTICILLVFVIEQMGGILALIITLQGIVAGPLLGLFTLGVLFPMANAKGAFYGGILGMVTTIWIVFNNKWYEMHGFLPTVEKPVSIDGCDFFVNITRPLNRTVLELPFVLYRISFWYNCFIGISLVLTLGLIISWFTRNKDTSVHRDLLSPFIYSMLSMNDQNHLELNQTLSLILNHEKENK